MIPEEVPVRLVVKSFLKPWMVLPCVVLVCAVACGDEAEDIAHSGVDIPATASIEALELFQLYCASCHGAEAQGTSVAPQLR